MAFGNYYGGVTNDTLYSFRIVADRTKQRTGR